MSDLRVSRHFEREDFSIFFAFGKPRALVEDTPSFPYPNYNNSERTQMAEKTLQINQHFITVLGFVASALSVCMYVSYIFNMRDYITDPAAGHAFPIQTVVAFVNCTVWTVYAFLLPKKQVPIIVANLPGIVVTAATVICWFVVVPH